VAELEKTWGDQFDQSNAENDKLIKSDELTAMVPVAGKVIAMKDVPDEVFSTGKMGQGIAIKPTDGKVYAPFDAEVKTVFATRHAIGLDRKSTRLNSSHVSISYAVFCLKK